MNDIFGCKHKIKAKYITELKLDKNDMIHRALYSAWKVNMFGV